MKRFTKFSLITLMLVLALGLIPNVMAQDVGSVCLVTDEGRVNDGTFNQFAHEGAVAATEDFELEYTFIETQATTDYEANVATCIEEGFDIVITVGFLIGDATSAAAIANPDVFFIGVDQFVADGPENYVGIQYREDEVGFVAGALAALVAEDLGSDTIAGVYGRDIPPVKRFRNGYEQGAMYINPDINTLGVYIDDFVAPDRGASAAEQFMGEGASVIFGAGGPTGTGGILTAAAEGVLVIGVDQDEWISSFGEGETPGSENIISSAGKRVDLGVYDMIQALVDGDMEAFVGGGNHILNLENEGVGLTDSHEYEWPEGVAERIDEIVEGLIAGDISTGVDPVSGDLEMMDEDMDPDATEEADG